MNPLPRYPRREHDTAALLRSLAVAGIMFIILLVATSCAPTAPRAIIPPKAEIAKLDVAPVASASGKTRTAVRDVSRHVDANRAAADRVGDEAARIKAAVAAAKNALAEDYEISLAAVDAIADSLVAKVRELQHSLALTAAARDIALATMEDQEKEINHLAARVAAQTVEIDHASATEDLLRAEVESLSALPEKLAKAEQKATTLQWWVWRLAGLSLALAILSAGLGYLLIKP